MRYLKRFANKKLKAKLQKPVKKVSTTKQYLVGFSPSYMTRAREILYVNMEKPVWLLGAWLIHDNTRHSNVRIFLEARSKSHAEDRLREIGYLGVHCREEATSYCELKEKENLFYHMKCEDPDKKFPSILFRHKNSRYDKNPDQDIDAYVAKVKKEFPDVFPEPK